MCGAGEDPPPLGLNFPTSEQDKLRRAGKLPPHQYDTTSTYSFSFHSMFMDFPVRCASLGGFGPISFVSQSIDSRHD
jgi:hypothetical protein